MSRNRLSGKEKKRLMEKAVKECEDLIAKYLLEWRPVCSSWETIEGAVYLRVSDPSQVLVEHGSFLQQVNICAAEAVERSHKEKVNYKITKFFIEPGITGKTENRPSFQRMRGEIGKGFHRFIIFKEISRLVRDAIIWKKFFNVCIEKECEIIIKGLPFNPNDPSQVHQLDQIALNAEYESKQISKRTKETNHAAMVFSKKFNSTHLILGFDQLIENGHPVVGRYVPNYEELKTVEWIFRSFIKYGSYVALLAECERRNIKNKDGSSFNGGTIRTLLKNKKYIGKWDVNKRNKQKKQDKLMAYERFQEVDLPHGCLIDITLWNQVQAKIVEVGHTNDKVEKVIRVYLLSTLLVFEDGSPFYGQSPTGKHVSYYHNQKNNIRVDLDSAELKAREVLQHVINNSKMFQEALKIALDANKSKQDLMGFEKVKIQQELDDLKDERKKLDNRLDFFLAGSDQADAEDFRREYNNSLKVLNEKKLSLEQSLVQMDKAKEIFKKHSLNLSGLLEKVRRVLEVSESDDKAALKNAYREVFSKIIVGKKDKDGVRSLKFILKSDDLDFLTEESLPVGPQDDGHSEKQEMSKMSGREEASTSSADHVASGKKVDDRLKMGWLMGLEPTTPRITI